MTWISNLAQLKYYEELIGFAFDAVLIISLLAFCAYLGLKRLKKKMRERKLRKKREEKHHQN